MSLCASSRMSSTGVCRVVSGSDPPDNNKGSVRPHPVLGISGTSSPTELGSFRDEQLQHLALDEEDLMNDIGQLFQVDLCEEL